MENPIVQAIHQGQEDFLNYPLTKTTVEALLFVTTDGIESIGYLRAIIEKLSSIAAKTGGQGGLNLFKWGAEQTGKSSGWKAGDYILHLPNKGTPKLNWKANYGALRREMRLCNPIYNS